MSQILMAYLIVLWAALMHAIWNSIIKESTDRLLTLGAIRFVGLIFGLSVILLTPTPDSKTLFYLLGTSLIFFVYYFFLITAYKLGDFSQVYPISRGTAPLIVLLFSVFYTGDSPSQNEIIAILLISLGVLSLSFSKNKKPKASIASNTAIVYALCTAVAIASYTQLCGVIVRYTDSFLVIAGYIEFFSGVGVLTFIARTRKINPVTIILIDNRKGLCAGLISVFGYASALWAMTVIPIASVAALRETSIIFAGLIGTIYFKEGHTLARIGSACIVALGVILIGL